MYDENNVNIVTENGVSESKVLESSNIFNSDNLVLGNNEQLDNKQKDDKANSRKQSTRKLMKIILVLIPLQEEKSWANKYDDKDYGEMHFIVADNLYLAKEKFKKYLEQCVTKNVENLIFDTHGGGAGLIYVDNVNGTFELGKNFIGNEQLLNYRKTKGKIKQNILSLKMMVEAVKDYGNVILLGCTVCKGENGRIFSRKIHEFNYRTNTFVSEAFNTGSIDENSDGRPWYVYLGKFQPTIDWDKGANILNEQGTDFEYHQNQKGEGFKLFTAFKGEFVNLEIKTPSEFGNLFIDGENARLKY